ncbi:hypothetical protein [Micromonospora sagamiensis]|uniref:Uncharacterized protein n=1 Tax=Micromonospora sagamiensis TaxID=47875 RepID=A0A562WDF9_9ACTN|nr:hypothetical protein [Micromonospora sagamiensis]TWJ28319.1 hypothetical protein JD81_01823 [Micromonospora sagamiensis]BCL12789.1 hypothetical protein GCM10017556_05280 [Micromonospora sagamiensis]
MDVRTEGLRQLATLLRAREELDDRITALIGRPAHPGNIGEFIAARVFDIELACTAVQAGYDGVFRSGPLAGRTVNVKNYGDALSGLDISSHPCDHYLVLSSRRCAPAHGHARAPAPRTNGAPEPPLPRAILVLPWPPTLRVHDVARADDRV